MQMEQDIIFKNETNLETINNLNSLKPRNYLYNEINRDANKVSDSYPEKKFRVFNTRSSYNEKIQNRCFAYKEEQYASKSISEEKNLFHSYPLMVNEEYTVFRSNSNLNLENKYNDKGIKREYGSQNSLDVIGKTNDSFFAVLQNFKNIEKDQHSPCSEEVIDLLHGKFDLISLDNINNIIMKKSTCDNSPKLKTKFSKFWEMKDKTKGKGKWVMLEPTLFRKKMKLNVNFDSQHQKYAECMLEEDLRKFFIHYDCQSMTVNLNYASKLKLLLSKRRNTTTGASAASMFSQSLNKDNLINKLVDVGDGKDNDLVYSCHFFRNEMGGETENAINILGFNKSEETLMLKMPQCKFNMSCSVSILEMPPGKTHWVNICPYQQDAYQIENVDHGASYYKKFFYNQEHQNWFGFDDNLGPIAISIKKEKICEPVFNELTNKHEKRISTKIQHLNNGDNSVINCYQYRLIIRTSELATLRGVIFEDAISVQKTSVKNIQIKDVIEYVAPEIQLHCLRLATSGLATENFLVKLDQQCLNTCYKVGIMYCKANQSTEEEMYNNKDGGPAFEEFLEMLGEKIRLKGFDKYGAGLDRKSDSTGMYSLYTTYQGCEIMFHVSTLLPFTPNNRQQLLRKRHIGNDIVTIIFQEPGAKPFTPKNIRSQFQHVFIIVRVKNPCTTDTQYRIAVSRSKDVPSCGPIIPKDAIFSKSSEFTNFILCKKNAAHRSEKFVTMATRTRQEYLKDLATNYVTNSTIESTPRFQLNVFGNWKRDRCKNRILPAYIVRGALRWCIQVENVCHSKINCWLGISTDTLVIINIHSGEIIFTIACDSILGWAVHDESIRLYYHVGESILIFSKTELLEILERLQGVTQGSEVKEIKIQRSYCGPLGFHIRYDGLVTEVEQEFLSWKCGLRPGSRVVEICKVAVPSLDYIQMIDLLRTSAVVTLTVVPPIEDSHSYFGCSADPCPVLFQNSCSKEIQSKLVENNLLIKNQPNTPLFHSNIHSDYGTGSSWNDTNLDRNMNTLTSSSSGQSSSEDRWFDVTESVENKDSLLPPPLPARSRLPFCDNLQSTIIIDPSHVSSCKELSCLDEEATSHIPSSPKPKIKKKNPFLTNNNYIQNDSPRLRPGAVRSSNRTNALVNSTFVQEELIKLIKPEEDLCSSGDHCADLLQLETTATPLPLPDATALDWQALVCTATQAMDQAKLKGETINTKELISQLGFKIKNGDGLQFLKKQIHALQLSLQAERNDKAALENEVKQLKNENRRLQEESFSAAQELQRFTEWFFSAVEKCQHSMQ